MICPFCKAEINDGSYFCTNCNSMINLEDVWDIFKPENEDKFNKFIEKLKNKNKKT